MPIKNEISPKCLGISLVIGVLCLNNVLPLNSFAGQGKVTPWSEISPPVDDLIRSGRYEQAVENAKQEAKRAEVKWGKDSLESSIAQSQLGRVYQALNRFDEAVIEYEHSLKIRKALFGASDTSVAVSLLDLADTYREAGQYSRAGLFYEQALAAIEKAKGPIHPDVAVVLHNFAMLRNFQLNVVEAEGLIRRAVAIREKLQDKDLYPLVGSLALQGEIYEQQDKYSEARASYDKALKVMDGAQLSQDYTAGMLSFAIGNLEGRRRNYQDADRFYGKSLKILEAISGAESPVLVPILQSRAHVFRKLNRPKEAKEAESRADALLKYYNENNAMVPSAPPAR
ncbi:MAG: tetratricopeptide repeat protein [Nitrospira sp.]|nr:tetratricopeptide repeat protein [Nitrospira sp.]